MTGKPLRLDARCPVCKTPPAIRVNPRTIALYRDSDPEEVVQTVQCQHCMRSRRIVHYDITAAAYQKAG